MSWQQTRSAIGNAIQRDKNADVTELRRQLKAERLEVHVREIVNSTPPLTDEQCARIAALLRPGGGT